MYNRAAIIFLTCGFFYLLFFLAYFQPSQIGCLPYFHTWCGLSANLRCRSETWCTRLAENTGRKNSPKNRHLGTIAQLCRAISSQLRHIPTIGKKLLSINTCSTRPHNMVNFGLLTAEIGSVIWGTLPNVIGFRVLAALLHGTQVVGISQTLRRWTEGATYTRQGGHHVGHWPTFLVLVLSSSFFSSPNLSRRRLDVCHTSTHGVALVRI